MKKFKGVLVAILLSAFTFSGLSVAQAITFGEEVLSASSDYPSVISIWYKESLSDTPQFICTGTAIQTNIVLTAAHCVLNKGFYYVKAGVDRLEDEAQLISVPATWRNPKYSASQGVNDIGLLLLESELPDLSTTRLPTAKQITSLQANKKTKYEIVGWGIDQNGDDATYLRRAAVDDQSIFMKKYKGWRNDVWVAVGKYNKKERVFAGACNGDSGGPLFAVLSGVRTLAGVTSWGAEDCETVSPSVYVRLSYYVDTIRKVGIPTLLANKVTANRLPPEFVSKPTIGMQERDGYLLTCDFEGSPGTTSLITWSSASYTFSNSHSKAVLLEPGQSVANIKCTVDVSNANGKVSQEAVYQIPAAPSVSTYPELSRMPASVTLDGTQQVTCTPASGAGFTQISNSFWAGKTASYDSAQAVKVGDGNSLTLSKQFLEQFGGKYLYCVTSMTSNVSKKTIATYGAAVPEILAIKFDYTNISFTGTYYPSSYNAPADNETIGCAGKYSSLGDKIASGFDVTFLVGGTSDPTLATVLTKQNPFTVTSDIRNAIRGKYLFCKFTYTNLAGTSSGYASSFIGKDLPPYSVSIDIQGVNSYTDLAVGSTVKCVYTPAKGSTVGSVNFMTTNGFINKGDNFVVTQDILNQIVGQNLICNVYVTNGESGGTFSANVVVKGVKVVAPVVAPAPAAPAAPAAPVAPVFTCVKLKNGAVDQASKTPCTALINLGINTTTRALDSTISLSGNVAQASVLLTLAPGDAAYTNWMISDSNIDKNNLDNDSIWRLTRLNSEPANPLTLSEANLAALKGKYLVAFTSYNIQGLWILESNGLSVLPSTSVDSVLIP